MVPMQHSWTEEEEEEGRKKKRRRRLRKNGDRSPVPAWLVGRHCTPSPDAVPQSFGPKAPLIGSKYARDSAPKTAPHVGPEYSASVESECHPKYPSVGPPSLSGRLDTGRLHDEEHTVHTYAWIKIRDQLFPRQDVYGAIYPEGMKLLS